MVIIGTRLIILDETTEILLMVIDQIIGHKTIKITLLVLIFQCLVRGSIHLITLGKFVHINSVLAVIRKVWIETTLSDAIVASGTHEIDGDEVDTIIALIEDVMLRTFMIPIPILVILSLILNPTSKDSNKNNSEDRKASTDNNDGKTFSARSMKFTADGSLRKYAENTMKVSSNVNIRLIRIILLFAHLQTQGAIKECLHQAIIYTRFKLYAIFIK